MKSRRLFLVITSFLLGFFIILQAKSFQNVSDIIGRDIRTDVFQEIRKLKNTNTTLEEEVEDLKKQLAATNDQEKSLHGIQQEIQKYRIASGEINVAGSGISFEFDGNLTIIWLVDIMNELFSAGAEAVSINDIRFTSKMNSFDTLPNGQILFQQVVIKPPFVFKAIGDEKVLKESLLQSQGIIERLSQSYNGIQIDLKEEKVIVMKKIELE